MDYLSVTQTAFFTATVLTFIASISLFRLCLTQRATLPFALGFTFNTAWLLLITLSYSEFLVSTSIGLIAELCHFLIWLLVMGALLRQRVSLRHWPKAIQVISAVALLICISTLVLITTPNATTQMISGAFAILAALLLVLTEQTIRNTSRSRITKLIGLCISIQFVFDAYLYGQIAISSSLEIGLWQTRAALAFTAALVITLSTILFSHEETNTSITLSRPVAFYSATSLVTALIFTVLGLGALYVRNLNGYIGSYLFNVAMVGAIILIGSLYTSRQVRSAVEVFINKHFFNFKYDYQSEWLRAISFNANHTPSSPHYYDHALNYVCGAFNSPAGAIWLNQDGLLNGVARTDHLTEVPSFGLNAPFVKLMIKEGWIYAPLSTGKSISQNNELLPLWFNEQGFWLVSPLLSQMKLLGFIAIKKPRQSKTVTFEDRDLMTNITNQLSSQMLIHQQETVISNNKQIEAYNRLSAFIMHDVNNVMAQLAFIVKNAEKHKHNPAFIDDMVKTVDNANERMRSLVEKFRPDKKDTNETIEASKVLDEVINVCSDKVPKPILEHKEDFTITADRQKLFFALKNLVRNAQEATNADGYVKVSIGKDTETSRFYISIQDNGAGMDAGFITNELFKPFSSTKEDKGMGIGAHLTKSYLESIGANLYVDSAIGKGSTFTIVFA
jgi:putative PEP-CTERM system histidine kinase